MDKLPKDVVELITNKLSPREFFNYCKSDVGQKFCLKREIWLRRIDKDFGSLLEGKNAEQIFPNYKNDPNKSYLELFLKTSRAAEEIKEKFLYNLGSDFVEFIGDKYRQSLFDFFFTYLLKMLNVLEISKAFFIRNISIEASEYVWDVDRDWKKYLPKLYNSQLGDFWDEEMGNSVKKYALEVFQPPAY
jgi:hypothetical protein